jgi:hypothetical protein
LRAAEPGFPKFEIQEIATDLKIGYAVTIADLNQDRKPDIIVVDQHRVVWYENPTWKVRTIVTGKTTADNVCVSTLDVDRDGKIDVVVGAGWKPFDTEKAGTLQWFRQGKSLEEEWEMFSIPCEEPTVHRVRTVDFDGDGKWDLVHVPLMGRTATRTKNWMDGRPIRVMGYQIPQDPTKPDQWKPIVLSDSLHVAHNFVEVPGRAGKPAQFLIASYEGISRISRNTAKEWKAELLHEGNQREAQGSRGASEIKQSQDRLGMIATIEPWHGNQVVVYSQKPTPGTSFALTRQVIDEQLRWGHAVSFADLDGDQADELIIGVRDDPNPKLGDTHQERRGVRIYRRNATGSTWQRMILENGGVAVEDLTVGDLNGDGKPDIVAVGRATGNCRIYWNQAGK